jgi:hypothetical protein
MQQLNYKMVSERKVTVCNTSMILGFKAVGETYLNISFKHIPAIATENLLMLFFSLFTTCFGPFGPSSCETQLYYLYISRKLSILQRIRCFTICLLLSIYTKANA